MIHSESPKLNPVSEAPSESKRSAFLKKLFTISIVAASIFITGALLFNLKLFSLGETIGILFSALVVFLMLSQREPSSYRPHSRLDF